MGRPGPQIALDVLADEFFCQMVLHPADEREVAVGSADVTENFHGTSMIAAPSLRTRL